MEGASAEERQLRPQSSTASRVFKTLAGNCIYTPYYCEENVWNLCAYVQANCPDALQLCYVVFISNANKMIPLWCQKASNAENGLVKWDYHVIFLVSQDRTVVYDLDSTLPFPYDFNSYAQSTFHNESELKPQFHRMFRVLPASDFLQTFASDRSHMKNEDGKWLKPPPSYPCIQLQNETNNLDKFISMKRKTGFGEVLTMDQFIERFKNPT